MQENDNKIYTKQFITWGLLALCCFLLAGILIIFYSNNQIGRYTLHVDNGSRFSYHILDTKTSHVWHRVSRSGSIRFWDFGTIEKPTFEESERSIPEPSGKIDFVPVDIESRRIDTTKYEKYYPESVEKIDAFFDGVSPHSEFGKTESLTNAQLNNRLKVYDIAQEIVLSSGIKKGEYIAIEKALNQAFDMYVSESMQKQ